MTSSTRSTRSARPAVAGLLAAALLGALPGTATAAEPLAGSGTFRDAHGDIRPGVDLWKVEVTHAKAVRIDLTHRDLVRSGKSSASATVYLDTDPSKAGPELALSTPLFEGSDYLMSPVRDWKTPAKAAPVSCHYRVTLDYAADVAHVRVGRDCLGKAEKVRVAVRAGAVRADGTVVRDWLQGYRHLTRWVARS